MSHLLEQIAVEQQRIAVFEAKIANCKKRIESLEYLLQDSDDELDTLASISSVTGIPVTPQKNAKTGGYVRTKPMGEKQRRLLKFIGKDGKALKEMFDFANANNLGMTPQNIRNFAMIYRKRYGYIESPHTGFYRITESGINAIK